MMSENLETVFAEQQTIEFDKKTYHANDKVMITIIAPNFNLNPQVIEKIGDHYNPIKVSTLSHYLDNYIFVETDKDTGRFMAEISLTGFEFDYDGDGDIDKMPEHSGSGPYDGKLPS